MTNPNLSQTVEDPVALLRNARERAFEAKDPNAGLCTLALAEQEGTPSIRTLVLRDLLESTDTPRSDEVHDHFAVFINRSSPKHRTITAAQTGRTETALLVWLASIQCQFRLRAQLTPMDPTIVAKSWQLRPEGSKLLDWFYENEQPQSSVIANRETLRKGVNAQANAINSGAPQGAVGFWITAQEVDILDLSAADRLHERRRFTRQTSSTEDAHATNRSQSTWRMDTLVP